MSKYSLQRKLVPNQIILAIFFVRIIRVPMVGTRLIMQKTAILLKIWEPRSPRSPRSPRKIAEAVLKDLRKSIP